MQDTARATKRLLQSVAGLFLLQTAIANLLLSNAALLEAVVPIAEICEGNEVTQAEPKGDRGPRAGFERNTRDLWRSGVKGLPLLYPKEVWA